MIREETEKLTTDLKQGRFLTNLWVYILIVVFGLILSINIWSNLSIMPSGDDIGWQSTQLGTASAAWGNGQVVPQTNPNTLDGAGYGFNLFAGPLPSYLAAALHLFIGSWPVVLNLLLTITLIGSGLIMCRAVTRINQKNVLGALAGILYMATPYLLTDLYMRGAIDELFALTIAPFLLLGLFRLINHNPHAVRTLILAGVGLILTHSLSAALFMIVSAFFLLLNVRRLFNLESLWRIVLTSVGIIGLTAFFTLPIAEARLNGHYGVFDTTYLHMVSGMNATINHHRLAMNDLLKLDLTNTESSLTIGWASLLGILGFWFIRKKLSNEDERSFLTSLYIIMMIALFLVLPILTWAILPTDLLRIRFPWQLLEIFAVISPVITSYVIYYVFRDFSIEKQQIGVVMAGLIAIVSVQPFLIKPKVSENSNMTDSQLDPSALYAPTALLCNENRTTSDYLCSNRRLSQPATSLNKENAKDDGFVILEEQDSATSASFEELNLQKKKEDEKTSPKSETENPIPTTPTFEGDGEMHVIQADGLKYTLQVSNNENGATIELPIIYYPGYIAEVNHQQLTITPTPENGLIKIQIPASTNGIISVYYGLSPATKLGGAISLGTLTVCMIWLLVDSILHLQRRKENLEAEDMVESVREVLEFVEEDTDAALLAAFSENETVTEEKPKAKRGRKPKKKNTPEEDETPKNADEEPTKPKKRGRKSKSEAAATSDTSTEETTNAKPKTTRKSTTKTKNSAAGSKKTSKKAKTEDAE